MKGDILASSRRLKRKRFFLKLALYAAIFCVLFVGISASFYISKFRIQKISIQGNITLGNEEISSNILDSLKGKRFGIFPRDNIFILPKEEIKNNLLNNFPRLKAVSLDRDFPNALFVKIGERKPVALFCKEGGLASPAGGCSFIDEDGFVFEEAAFFSGNVYIKFYSEIGEMEIVNNFKQIMDFANLVSEENIKITGVVLAEEGLRKFYTSEGWHILINKNEDIRTAFENLKLTIREQIKDERQNLEYIDLRFGKKVYYKFR